MTVALSIYSTHLQRIGEQISNLEQQLAEAREAEADTREAIRSHMESQGIKTAEAKGLKFSRRMRSETVVEDANSFREALEEADLSQFCVTTRFDLVKAKKIGLEHEIPGVSVVQRESLVITVLEGGEE